MISIDLIGRLGNQMFQYSVCRLIAEKNGYDFHIPRNINQTHILSDFFNLNMGLSSCQTNFFYNEHESQTFDSNIFNIKDGTKIWGYFQTEKYFEGFENSIKEWFRLDLDDVTKSILEEYPVDNYCYIHFRGTDYKDWNNGNFFLPKSYYEDAINYVKKINDKLKFVVITDDVKLAKTFFDYDVISNDMMIDFKLLLSSKYCIIPNSTFSWWSAWLSEKELVIAPNFWLNYNNPQLGFYPVDIKVKKFTYI